MKLLLMPKEPTWWTWLATVVLLGAGLAGWKHGFHAAIALSLAQTVFFIARYRSLAPMPVQIRIAYTAFLFEYLLPPLRWMFWVPAIGTTALLLFGYCLMARLLSLMPWNRREPFSLAMLRRALFTPPVVGRADHGLPAAESLSICELEALAATTHQGRSLAPDAGSAPSPREGRLPAFLD